MSYRTRLLTAAGFVIASAVLRPTTAAWLMFRLSIKLDPRLAEGHVEAAKLMAARMVADAQEQQGITGVGSSISWKLNQN